MTKSYTRREILRLASLTAGALGSTSLLSACGAPPPATTGGGGGGGGEEAAGPTATPVKAEVFGSESAKTKIRFWTILASVDGIIMNDLAKRFASENPDIAVESLQGLPEFIQKLQAASISDTAPDVIIARHTYVAPFVTKKIIEPIEKSELEQSGIRSADYDPTAWSFTQFDGHQYGVPLDVHCHAMYYSKPLLSAAGLEPPTTLEEWAEVAEKVTKDDIIGYQTFALGAGAQEFLTWYWYGIHRQFGGEMLSADASKAAFNTPEGIEAVRWMKRIQEKSNPKNAPTVDLQRAGKVGSWADGPWTVSLFFNKEKSSAAEDLDVAPLPQHDPANKATWAQSHLFALPRQGNPDPEKRAAALKFIRWMSEHSADWAKAGQIPARNSARETAMSSDDPYLKKLRVWASQLPYVAFMPSSPSLLEVMPRIAVNVEGAILGQWSVEEGLKQAEDEVNRILKG